MSSILATEIDEYFSPVILYVRPRIFSVSICKSYYFEKYFRTGEIVGVRIGRQMDIHDKVSQFLDIVGNTVFIF